MCVCVCVCVCWGGGLFLFVVLSPLQTVPSSVPDCIYMLRKAHMCCVLDLAFKS